MRALGLDLVLTVSFLALFFLRPDLLLDDAELVYAGLFFDWLLLGCGLVKSAPSDSPPSSPEKVYRGRETMTGGRVALLAAGWLARKNRRDNFGRVVDPSLNSLRAMEGCYPKESRSSPAASSVFQLALFLDNLEALRCWIVQSFAMHQR